MIIRVVYESYGIERGYNMYCRDKQDIVERLNRLGVYVDQINKVFIDDKPIPPEELYEKD